MDENDEVALSERDERIKDEIECVIKYQSELAERYEEDARELRKCVERTKQAVKAEKWWELENILEDRDIESLCSIGPTNLLEE